MGVIYMENLFQLLSIIFLMLLLACLVTLIIGLIKPQLVIRRGDPKKRTKGNVLKYYGIPLIVCFILLLTTYASLENVKAVKVAKDEVLLEKKIASDKAIADKKVEDKIIAGKLVADKIASDKIKAKEVADKAIKDKVIADKLIADKAESNRRIANEQKATTGSTTIKKSTNTGTDYTSEIATVDSQIETQNYILTTLTFGTNEYGDALEVKAKLLQKSIDLRKKQLAIELHN